MPELRRRFCDQGWRLACNGVVFTGASSVAVTRYRYRGSKIADPVDPDTGSHHLRLTSGQGTWRARCAERRTPGAGGRPRETTGGNIETAPADRPHVRHEALVSGWR